MERLGLGDQKGVALVVALIMLLVLTFLGMSSVISTIFESKLSGNERWGSAAFYLAAAGVDVGISHIPDITAYSETIGSDESYRSGKMIPRTLQPSKVLGTMVRPGYESTWEFRRFQVNATGEAFGAVKEIEVQVSLGPFPAGTQYN